MIFLPIPSLEIEQRIATEEGVTVCVSLTPKHGNCPDCQSGSSRVQSRYQRTLKDLACQRLVGACEAPRAVLAM